MEKLRRNGANADIAEAAQRMHKNEITLLMLKRAGVAFEIMEACFLLSQCSDSLIPERIEALRRSPLARTIKIGELRALLQEGDMHAVFRDRWEIGRKSLVHALDILENGARADEPSEKKPTMTDFSGRDAEFFEETEEMHHVALSGRSS